MSPTSVDGLIRMMDTDDFIGPVNLGNPDEFTILELAEKVLRADGQPLHGSSTSPSPRTTPSAAARTSPWPKPSSAGSPRSTSTKGWSKPSPISGKSSGAAHEALRRHPRLQRKEYDPRALATGSGGRPSAWRKRSSSWTTFPTDGTRGTSGRPRPARDQGLFHAKNMGKGSALRTGFSEATGDIVLVQDADLEYDPGRIPALLAPILDGRADVVYGSRFLGGPHRVLFFWHSVGNRFLTAFSNIVTNLNLTDMETCYKVFRRDVLRKLRPQVTPFRIRARGHGQGRQAQVPDLRSPHLLRRPGLCRRQEDRLGRTAWRPFGISYGSSSFLDFPALPL